MRGIVRAGLGGAATAMIVVAALVGVDDGPAAALDCEARPPSQMITDAPIAFVGEQVDESGFDQRFRVDRWITPATGGDDVVMQRDEDWGQSYLERGVRVFLGYEAGDGTIHTALCGNALDPIHAELASDDGIVARAGGNPAFVVATREMDGIVAALLNAAGEPIHYAPGDGAILEFARCPGDDLVATVAADDYDDYLYDGPVTEWSVELRTTSDLTVVDRWTFEVPATVDRSSPGLIDLRCHVADGSVLTTIVPVWGSDGIGGRPIVTSGTVATIRDGVVERTLLGWPRSVTYDASTDTVHMLVGEDGDAIFSKHGTGETNITPLPEPHIGWHLEVDDGEFEIISANLEVDSSNATSGIISHLLTGPLDALVEQEIPIASQFGTLVDIHDTPDGRLFHIADGTAKALVLDADNFDRWTYYDLQWFQRIAPRGDTVLWSRADTSSGLLIGDGVAGTPVERVISREAIVPIWPAAEIVYETPTTTATTTTTTITVATTDDEQAAGLLDPPDDDDGAALPGWWPIVVVVIVALGGTWAIGRLDGAD